MKYYYVKEVNDNQVTLKNIRLYEKLVNIHISDLENFSKENIIIGYNKISHQVNVSSISDVEKYIYSKFKLAGLKQKGIEFNEILKCFSCDVEYELRETGKDSYDLRLFLPDLLTNVCSRVTFDWSDIFSQVLTSINSGSHLQIIFDMTLPEYAFGKPFSSELGKKIKLKNISFTDKFDMSETKMCVRLFHFENHNQGVFTDDIIDTKNVVIDLQRYNASKVICISNMFSNFKGSVIFPEFNEIMEADGVLTNTVLTQKDVDELLTKLIPKIYKATDYSKAILYNVIFQQVTIKDIQKLIKYITSSCRINELVITKGTTQEDMQYIDTLRKNTISIDNIVIEAGFETSEKLIMNFT